MSKEVLKAKKSPKLESLEGYKIIDNKYYKLGDTNVVDSGECYFIGGTYRKYDPKIIVYNFTESRYMLRKDVDSSKAVEADSVVNKKIVRGIAYNDDLNVFLNPNSHVAFYGIHTLRELKIKYIHLGFREIYASNDFKDYHLSSKQNYKDSLIDLSLYGASNNPYFKEQIKLSKSRNIFLYENLAYSRLFLKYSSLLAPFSYGIELETSSGNVPETFLKRYHLTPVRDGSITGHEYITVPLDFRKVLSYAVNIADIIDRSCSFNAYCSYHLHIGNVPKTIDYVTNLFVLCYRLQSELFEIFEPFKTDAAYMANKSGGAKNHCMMLPSLGFGIYNKEQIGDNIMRWLTNGKLSVQDYENGVAYKVPNNKWNIDARYYFVNFFNLLLTSGTVEFRLHSGTANKYKIVYWIFICTAIIKYAQMYPKRIMSTYKKVKLIGIIEEIYKEEKDLKDTLIGYIKLRQDHYINNSITKNTGTEQIQTKFEYNPLNLPIFQQEKRLNEILEYNKNFYEPKNPLEKVANQFISFSDIDIEEEE
jgi:hypothetical protein